MEFMVAIGPSELAVPSNTSEHARRNMAMHRKRRVLILRMSKLA
eukprot:CAMPEP_0113999432 /NCGR_PEP_ID=MMETSP0328-20130328/13383_1 /TAXON_ID=39455 /ORGANISM="Alexandrium minutum" /LENGTH=43 /assembly_acc=CAM_ASM_000350